jgi:hypothetical protein
MMFSETEHGAARYKGPAGVAIITILGVISAVFFFTGCFGKEDPEAWRTKDNSLMADLMMRDFVKKRLKSPSAAQFAPATEKAGRIIEKQADSVYFVKSFVDSQNSFGASVRIHYHGEIKQISKDNWQLISLEFED